MRSVFGVGAAFVLGVVALSGCGSVPAKADGGGADSGSAADDDAAVVVPKHKVTITSMGNGTGSVTSSPAGIACGSECSADFDEGTSVTLHATSDGGSTFVGWSGGACTGTGDCSFTVTSEVAVQALFALNNSVVVSLAGSGVGMVVSSPSGIICPSDCSEAYGPGQTITLTATAGSESVFTGWSGGTCTGTGTCTVTSDAAVGVVATFALKQYALTVTKAGSGSGTVASNPAGVNCGSTCTANYDSGTSVTLVANESAGSTFVGWSGGGCTGTGSCTVSMSTARSITATFTLNQYPLTVTKGGNGSGTVISNPSGINCGSTCAASFNFGQSVTLTATPITGSTFGGWSGGGCSGTGTCVVPISAATTVTATFTLNQYVLTVMKGGNGSGTVTSNPSGINCGSTCAASFNFGQSVTLSAAPSAGSAFGGWSGGGCSGSGTCVVPISAATTVTATFTLTHCSAHSQCTSDLCDFATGACVPETMIAYASPTGSASSSCTKTDRCTLPRAVAVADATRSNIRLAGGTYVLASNSILSLSKDLQLFGPARIEGSGLSVSGGVTVKIRDLELAYNFNVSTAAVNGPMPTVELENVSIVDGWAMNVQTAVVTARNLKIHPAGSDPCIYVSGEEAGYGGATANRRSTVTIDRSEFDASSYCISLNINSSAQITNSVFRNSMPTTYQARALHVNNPAPSSISFSTLHNVQLACAASGTLTVRNSIVLNERSDAGTDVVLGPAACDIHYSILKPQATAVNGSNNKLNLDPRFVNGANGDYHLIVGSPAIDAADPNATEPVDFEGTVRPQGTRRDIGAFEYTP